VEPAGGVDGGSHRPKRARAPAYAFCTRRRATTVAQRPPTRPRHRHGDAAPIVSH
jgi:hypothetical protein